MRLARRLPLLAFAALALPALAPSGAAGAGGSCTTFAGGRPEARLSASLSSTNCAEAVLVVTPQPAAPDGDVTLDGSQSVGGDVGDDIATYRWDFGDASPIVQTTPPTATTTHRYARGVYTARLTLLDVSDVTLDSTAADVVVSALPVAVLHAPSGTLRPGIAYGFDAIGSDAPDRALGGSIVSYHWDWGDGSTSDTTDPTTQHTFAGDGASRQVSVTAVNDLGLDSAPASAAVTVLNQLPLVQLLATPATVQIGQQLTLDAGGTSDQDGNVVEYRWDLDANGSFETSTRTTPSVLAGGYPNPGVIVLRVKAMDDSGGSSVKGVAVTVAQPAGGGGGSGGGGGGSGSGGGSGASGSRSAGSGSGAGGGSAGGSGPGGGASDPFAVGLTGAAIQRLKAALRRGIGLQAVANRAATGTLTMSVAARDAHTLHLPGRRGKRPVQVGTLRLALSAGRTAKPAIKLTGSAARALRRAKPRTLRVTIRGSLVAGGDSAAVVRVVLLQG